MEPSVSCRYAVLPLSLVSSLAEVMLMFMSMLGLRQSLTTTPSTTKDSASTTFPPFGHILRRSFSGRASEAQTLKIANKTVNNLSFMSLR